MIGMIPRTVLQDGSIEVFWGQGVGRVSAFVETLDSTAGNPVAVPAVRAIVVAVVYSFFQKVLEFSGSTLKFFIGRHFNVGGVVGRIVVIIAVIISI